MGLAGDINPPLIHQFSGRVCAGSFEGRYTHTRVNSLQPTRFSHPSHPVFPTTEEQQARTLNEQATVRRLQYARRDRGAAICRAFVYAIYHVPMLSRPDS